MRRPRGQDLNDFRLKLRQILGIHAGNGKQPLKAERECSGESVLTKESSLKILQCRFRTTKVFGRKIFNVNSSMKVLQRKWSIKSVCLPFA